MSTLCVIWRAAELLFATEADVVVEVLAPLAWRPVPAVPAWVRGLFAHRGQLIPLVDVTRLLDAPARADRMSNRVLVANCAASSDLVPWRAGLWIDCIVEVDRLDFTRAGSHPGFAVDSGRFLGPVVETRWGPVQLVNPDRLFTAEQAAVLSERLKEAVA